MSEARARVRDRGWLPAMACACLALCGCGQRGALYMPDRNARVVTRPAATSAPDAASAPDASSPAPR